MSIAAVSGPTAYWYLARGTGVVSLLLLTASVVIGILNSERYAAPRWPRFAVDRIHRDVSLLVLAVLVVHIVTSVLDGFVPITLLDGVIPFSPPTARVARARSLGLRCAAGRGHHEPAAPPHRFSGLARRALGGLRELAGGRRPWPRHRHRCRSSWISWSRPVHGRDRRRSRRAGAARRHRARLRTRAVAGHGRATPLVLAVFTVIGPLAPRWARRAGTPVSVLRQGPSARRPRPPPMAPGRFRRDAPRIDPNLVQRAAVGHRGPDAAAGRGPGRSDPARHRRRSTARCACAWPGRRSPAAACR